MACPFHDGNDDGEKRREGGGKGSSDEANENRGIDRRSFLRSALTIGGASAFSTTVSLFGMPEEVAAADRGVSVSERANRQHSWNAYEQQVHGTFRPPENHLLLFADYSGKSRNIPSASDRKEAREVFNRLEDAFGWHHEGVLFTVGYSVSYFERFSEDVPRGLQTGNGAIPRVLTANQIIEGPTIPVSPALQPGEEDPEKKVDLKVTLPKEDPVSDDDYDVCIHLASDNVQNLLAAEQTLWGKIDEIQGISFGDTNLDGIFTRPTEYPERRVGFLGNENLEEKVDGVGEEGSKTRERFEESVSQGAELSMGYNDLYKNSMPREDNVTFLEDQRFLPGPPNWQPPGVFANGSIMHVSRLDNDLEGWYGENTDTERRHRMFSPHHTKEDVGEVGENLGPRESNAPVADEKPEEDQLPMRDFTNDVKDVAQRTEEDFREGRNIGHAQKVARARAQLEAHFRNEGGGPPIDIPQRDDKVARERDDFLEEHDGIQSVESGFLRRDFNTVDGGQPGTHFVALQAFSIYIAYMRHAMNGVYFDSAMIGQPTTPNDSLGFEHDADDGENPDHGILEYVTTKRRGNFILPPIRQRALPHPNAIKLVGSDTEVETLDGTPLPPYVDPDGEFVHEWNGERQKHRITVQDRELGAAVDPDSVRFGFYRDVNAGGGATPEEVVERQDGRTAFVFDTSDTRLIDEIVKKELNDDADGPATVRARLYAERESDLRPVFGTTTVKR